MDGLPPLFAHRLGRVHGPDSSRAALRATLLEGVDGVESDVCLTADGRLALLHDPWLRAGTTLEGWAHRTAWRDLRRGRLRDRAGAATSEPPMLVEELFDEVPAEVAVQLDVKAYGDPALARATVAAIDGVVTRRTDRRRLEVLSFHVAACEEAARCGLAARLIAWADYAPAALGRWAARAGVRGVCIEHFLLHAQLVERLRAHGLSVATGTINDAALAARAAALGVDAISTDQPGALRNELAAAAAA